MDTHTVGGRGGQSAGRFGIDTASTASCHRCGDLGNGESVPRRWRYQVGENGSEATTPVVIVVHDRYEQTVK